LNINTPILPLLCVVITSLVAGWILGCRVRNKMPAAYPLLIFVTIMIWATYAFLHARGFTGGLHVGFFGNAV